MRGVTEERANRLRETVARTYKECYDHKHCGNCKFWNGRCCEWHSGVNEKPFTHVCEEWRYAL